MTDPVNFAAMNRRTLLGTAAAATAATVALPLASGQALAQADVPKQANAPLPGVFRYRVGSYELTSLFDGFGYPSARRKVRSQRAGRSGPGGGKGRIPPGRHAQDQLHADSRPYRDQCRAAGFRDRRQAGSHYRHDEPWPGRGRHPAVGGHRDRDLAFPRRPHLGHQGRRQHAGIPQCRDPGSGSRIRLLDGRGRGEPRASRPQIRLRPGAGDVRRPWQPGAPLPRERRGAARHDIGSGLRPHSRPYGAPDRLRTARRPWPWPMSPTSRSCSSAIRTGPPFSTWTPTWLGRRGTSCWTRLAADRTLAFGYHWGLPNAGYVRKTGSGFEFEPLAYVQTL